MGMLPCPVLRCVHPAGAFVAGKQGLGDDYREAYVCFEHKALIDAGAPWQMEGPSVLMGQDIAPVLEGCSARPGVGAEGFTLTLRVAGQIAPVDVFLTPTEARTLAVFINAATSDSARQRLTIH